MSQTVVQLRSTWTPDKIVHGTLDANGFEILHAGDNARGVPYVAVASLAAARIFLEISHDDGSTWTRVALMATTAASGNGTTGFTFYAQTAVTRIPSLYRIVILDTSGAPNDFRAYITVYSSDDNS